ncbi:ABC transporter ATP-binding protein [Enterococcus sp. HY326]|uniref:ABC transporter ATP-binding protein n=1 Tax=Enterococcus sp. HY326 TaxID=2971265 RepID=UPI00223F4DBB|nr:ABC transporter ATP-binding protein [Enterococcus sp. HY326]
MNTPILTTKNICKTYRQQQVLNHISFTLQAGEIVALVGNNGAGKSTLINIINQLIPADEGQVTFFDGKANQKVNRQRVGVMLQKNMQLARVTVKETLNLARSYYQAPLPYQELLAIADLQGDEQQFVAKLSGGQKRRLSFAIALAGNPDILFLDEPTAGMDSGSRQKLWRLIEELRQQGKTFFVTSHYLEELENFAERILILKEAEIIFNGSLEQLRRQTAAAEISFHSQLSPKIFQSLPEVSEMHTTGAFYRLTTNDVNQLMLQLTPYLSGIENLSIQQNSLESLFTTINEGGAFHG